MLQSTHAGKLIHITGRDTAHRPVHPLPEAASASAHVGQLNDVNIVVINPFVIGEGEFSPPASLGFILKLVIDFGDEFVVANSV